jgi:hypothetical protein
VFENRMLRRILGLNRDDVTRGWRKLQDEGLHIFYFQQMAQSLYQAHSMSSRRPAGRHFIHTVMNFRVSQEARNMFDWLSDYQILNENLTSWYYSF